MDQQQLTSWCRQAVEQIKYPPEREQVRQELQNHLDDRYESFLAQGMAEKDAAVKTLEAMGDAKALAPQLAAVHKPFWGYCYRFSIYLLVIVACVTIYQLLQYGMPTFADGSAGQYWDNESYEILQETYSRVFHTQPGLVYRDNGYTLELTDAAIWECSDGGQEMRFRMELEIPLPWYVNDHIEYWIWAEDSLGNHYYAMAETLMYTEGPEQSVDISSSQTGWCTYEWCGYFHCFTSQEAEWIDLHYDRSGRNMVFRIDLTGGDPQ